MSEHTEQPKPGDAVPVVPPLAGSHPSVWAPVIFANCCGVWGVDDGLVGLSFEAIRHRNDGDRVETDSVTTLHLRLPLAGARQLRNILMQLELQVAKSEGSAN
jgi:hypothetical protein